MPSEKLTRKIACDSPFFQRVHQLISLAYIHSKDFLLSYPYIVFKTRTSHVFKILIAFCLIKFEIVETDMFILCPINSILQPQLFQLINDICMACKGRSLSV